VDPDVVAGVADDGDLGVRLVGRERPSQADQEARAADAAGQDRDAHRVILSEFRGRSARGDPGLAGPNVTQIAP